MILLSLTQDVQISPGADGRHAAAAQDRLALVVSGVAHHRTEDGQPAVEVAQAAGHHDAVLTPCDAQLDERPASDKSRAGRSGLKTYLSDDHFKRTFS